MGKKLFPYIIALAALAVSSSAAFYSVSGLMKLFAGAAFAVGIMAGSLEVSKLVIASLLYQYWDSLNKVLRTYLTIAAFVLILITSAGIYGFLSSAYQETANKSGLVDAQVKLLETKKTAFEKIKVQYETEKTSLTQNITSLRNALGSNTQSYVDNNGNVISYSSGANRKAFEKQLEVAVQKDEQLTSKIQIYNDSIINLETRIVETQSNSEVAAELGPLKYLSGLTGYPMDKIINWFLLVIIFVFDPLAIALVIAANFAFKHKEQSEDEEIDILEEGWIEDWDATMADGLDELDEEPNEDLKQAAQEHKETLEEQTKHTDWEIEDEESSEPYEVYTGPKEPSPLDKEIQSIQADKHLSDWGKRSRIEEAIRKHKKESEGKRYW